MDIWKPGIHGNEGKKLYRASLSSHGHIDQFDNYAGKSYQVNYKEYTVVKETHETFVLVESCDLWMLESPHSWVRDMFKTKRINKGARNKWAYPTEEEALRSLFWRKRAYKAHAKRRADEAATMYAHVKAECMHQGIDINADMKKETRYE